MCLNVKLIYSLPPMSIATKDITVYKKLRKNGVSPARGHRYRAGVLKKKVALSPREDGSIHEGYHAYTTKRAAFDNLWAPNRKIVKMTIPKGTGYYIGQNDEIVAERLYTGDLKALSRR